jgi:hypothetical protein
VNGLRDNTPERVLESTGFLLGGFR